MYPHFNYRTNWRTMPHHRCVFINVSAFLPYVISKNWSILIPINTAIVTLSYVIAVLQSVNIPWKSGKRVLFSVLKYLVHTCSLMWKYHENLGNEYNSRFRSVLFTFTAENISWSCSRGNNGYRSYTWKKSASRWMFWEDMKVRTINYITWYLIS